MKGLRICGWAVIFTVTLLLVACASPSPKVTSTSTMSGPDATMIQPDEQFRSNEDTPTVISQDWLDERERALVQREMNLDILENTLAVYETWLGEREMQLATRESDMARKENALAIDRAWLNEREAHLAKNIPDLTAGDDLLAFREVWGGGMTGQTEVAETLTEDAEPGAYSFAVEHGRCYASIYTPAQYRTVAVTKPIEVPQGEVLPRIYQTVTEQVKISDEETRWEEVLCQDKLTDSRISKIQSSLIRGGYNPGPIDGILGRQTMAAINAFQNDFNLTVTDYLTVETVSALENPF